MSTTGRFNIMDTNIFKFLKSCVDQIIEEKLPVGRSDFHVDLTDISIEDVAERLANRGIFAPEVLAERALLGVDFKEEARLLGISEAQTAAIYSAALDALSPEVRADIEQAVDHPKGKGALKPEDPDYVFLRRQLRLDEIRKVKTAELKEWEKDPYWKIVFPGGPTNAFDLRSTLGPARDQEGRGTCTAFGSTAVAESLEYIRDRRPGTRDLSEELLFWYSKCGQLYTAGGYSGGAALRHYSEYGSCEEQHFPYWGTELAANHAHVPAPDVAMDRAHFYTQDEPVKLPAGDVDAVKLAIKSGRCVAICSDVHGWNTGTGVIEFPDPLTSKGKGGGHCIAVIGFIDRDDLPAHFEGGYFIIRNSWGGAGSTSHLMGPEYGGHLLMPYGWYRRYADDETYSIADTDPTEGKGRFWISEYYDNESLRGLPIKVARTAKIDFYWGSGSPTGLPADNFSVRFTQVRRFREGWYRFRLRGDDGVRLWVDDRLVLNAWKVQAETEYSCDFHLSGGDHVLRVEYYEHYGNAVAKMTVDPINFYYEVVDDTNGTVVSKFADTSTRLEWRHAPPVHTHVAGGRFSLRGGTRMFFDAGIYRFHAQHTGACRIWIDNLLVLDDPVGNNSSGLPVTISQGLHLVKIEFTNHSTIPLIGQQGYYRAALAFSWSEETWQISFFDDQERKKIHLAGYPHLDSLYEAFRTQAITGSPIFQYRYSANHNDYGEYLAVDGVPLLLEFADLDKFKTGIPGSCAVPSDWLGAHIWRRVFVADAGRYLFSFDSDDAYRVIVDGKQILEDHHISDAKQTATEVDLEAGVHDFSIEYANSRWGGMVRFRMDRASWAVDYFDGVNFDKCVQTRTLDRVDRIISERPSSVGNSDYSVRARRMFYLPVGRYRIHLRADDGIRLKAGGLPLIDAWTDQYPTSYNAIIEHHGGSLFVELEYYQRAGGACLEMELLPEGFFAEYYLGQGLEKPLPGSKLDRNVPIAYRFEPAIDFDWGGGGPIPRVGAEGFSARWWGQIDLTVGRWIVELTADDGVRLFLDGRLVVDQWVVQPVTTHRTMVDLVGRRHDLRIEYFEKSGASVCRLAFHRMLRDPPMIV